MGTLIYDSTDGYDFDDRVLAHLQAVIATKLRRQEGFLLTWMDRTNSPVGTLRSIWLTNSISLQFVFRGPSLPELNREWVAAMAEKANRNGGLLFEDDLRATIRAATT
jgi:hypothetical protein